MQSLVTRIRSIARILPARIRSIAVSRLVGASRVRAKSFPVPSGKIPRAALQPPRAIPFTTSFNVPSPPADTTRSKSEASLANFSASPVCSLMQKRSGFNPPKRSRIASMFFTPPAIGLRMMQVRIALRHCAAWANEATRPFALASRGDQ